MSVVTPDLTDRSGTITTAGAAQQLLAQNSRRRGWRLMNNSSGDMWFNDTGGTASVAGAGSYLVAAGEVYESPRSLAPVLAVSLYGATAAQAFSAAEW